MAVSGGRRAKTAHVNMMTDTIIKNLPADGLRMIMRSMLATHPEITGTFEYETRKYIQENALPTAQAQCAKADLPGLTTIQQTIRCMLGCGLCYQALPLLGHIASRAIGLVSDVVGDERNDDTNILASIDGDAVQAVTAVQKMLLVASGMRDLFDSERGLVKGLYQDLVNCKLVAQERGIEFPYTRAFSATASLLGLPLLDEATDMHQILIDTESIQAPMQVSETFEMQGQRLPRIFSGLWQLSSPAWGSASTSKIVAQFGKHVQSGFTAFDMADHYGDAEIIFGRFRSSYPYKDDIFAATKYCVFHPITVTREAVRANVTERCLRLGCDKVDLLQFHWQFYDDPQYLDALRYLAEDERVTHLGLCNFDTEHLEAVINNDIKVQSNQIQFSLIDSRPTFRMGEVCNKNNIKLLTYGTLCGGFLADKWLNKPEPDLYHESVTPSQRKYHGMIRAWGDWNLFQELLQTLKTIGLKHNVSVSNVATRWVLDFSYVGAVIVGARMGISEHTDENMASLGWSLDQDDQEAINQVLKRSRRLEMMDAMGDCGGEYR